jgi:hypothetical protein
VRLVAQTRLLSEKEGEGIIPNVLLVIYLQKLTSPLEGCQPFTWGGGPQGFGQRRRAGAANETGPLTENGIWISSHKNTHQSLDEKAIIQE